VVPVLAAALSDPDPTVQRAAVDSLGQFGPAASSAIPALEQRAAAKADPCSAAPNALKKIRP
jgi:HEAT repeat protein